MLTVSPLSNQRHDKICLMTFFPLAGKIIALVSTMGISMVQGALFFSDTGPSETMATRLLIAMPLAMIGGVIFGYNFNRLWFFAGINAWVPAAFIGLSLAELFSGTVEPTELAILAMPLVSSITAGWFGAKMKGAKNLVMLAGVAALYIGALIIAGGYLDFGPI